MSDAELMSAFGGGDPMDAATLKASTQRTFDAARKRNPTVMKAIEALRVARIAGCDFAYIHSLRIYETNEACGILKELGYRLFEFVSCNDVNVYYKIGFLDS